MAKASDNVFPKIILSTGTTVASPTDGSWRLKAQADGIYAVSSNTTVGPLGAGGGGGAVATDTIWDAAGDLAVGSGADTAARLAIGAAGGALSVINSAVAWNSGTSFPANKATGDRYWRTDLGLECYYDGTRWLTTQLHATYFHADTGGAWPYTAAPFEIAPTWSADYDLYLLDCRCSTFVATTNSGSHYWSVALDKRNAANSATSLGSFDTSADTVNNWAQHKITINALLGTTNLVLGLAPTKSGTPGGLYIAGSVSYRLVVT